MNLTLAALQELIEIVAKLRSPDGGMPMGFSSNS